MEKLKQLTLEDRQTILPCSRKSDPIPVDILMDIFLRVPVKSIGRFSCVSKFWASILGHPDFTELFLTKSLTRPRLLFTFLVHGGKSRFFTSPQQLENSSSLEATPHPHLSFSPTGYPQLSPPVRGWMCIEERYNSNTFVICNPVTGKSITLPKFMTKMEYWSRPFLGYDPIDKQFKVLCTTCSHQPDSHAEHYVLTLGTEQMIWRMIDCCKPLLHPSLLGGGGICISGVLYYIAEINRHEDIMIVSFDIRFEKLSFINRPKYLERIGFESRLINHKGQLGIVQSSYNWRIDGNTTSFTLWLLKDTEKHEWVKHSYILPLLWSDVAGKTNLHIIGMTGSCEIVLAPHYILGPFCLLYYNLDTNIVRKVKIQGCEKAFEGGSSSAECFIDFVEDVKMI